MKPEHVKEALAIVEELAEYKNDACVVCHKNDPDKYRYGRCEKDCLGYRARALMRKLGKGKP